MYPGFRSCPSCSCPSLGPLRRVLDISPNHEIRVTYNWKFPCNSNGSLEQSIEPVVVDGHNDKEPFNPFVFSHTLNKFVAIGCDIFAYITDKHSKTYTNGCVSVCHDFSRSVGVNRKAGDKNTCTGSVCCQTTVPAGLKSFYVQILSLSMGTGAGDNNPCSGSRAFLAEQNFTDLLLRHNEVPAMMSWVIGNSSCQEILKQENSCGNNAHCTNFGSGHRCECDGGYQGNPYLTNGCQGIDNCEESKSKNCEERAVCVNTEGGFYCRCPPGFHGNGTKINRCIPDNPNLPLAVVIPFGIGVGLSLAIIIVMAAWCILGLERTRQMKQKQKFFKQNGGLLLRQQMASRDGAVEKIKIFISQELERATDNFNECRIRGKGGFGTVYKGMLQDGRIVAIKKSQIMAENQVAQFINEVVILPQVNHRNIVKLLGCCLETQVPLLVYEFVCNGTLSEHLRDNEGHTSFVSWEIA